MVLVEEVLVILIPLLPIYDTGFKTSAEVFGQYVSIPPDSKKWCFSNALGYTVVV